MKLGCCDAHMKCVYEDAKGRCQHEGDFKYIKCDPNARCYDFRTRRTPCEPCDEARVRYCVDGCGAHTRGKIKPFIVNTTKGDADLNDLLVCPWCDPDAEELSKFMCGRGNARNWVKGRERMMMEEEGITYEARVRYCSKGCGAHTRGKLRPFVPFSYKTKKERIDLNDLHVCPWCDTNPKKFSEKMARFWVRGKKRPTFYNIGCLDCTIRNKGNGGCDGHEEEVHECSAWLIAERNKKENVIRPAKEIE